ncbi:MAG: FlgD immunoglobulin-like domain containing protein, partial [bacterium]
TDRVVARDLLENTVEYLIDEAAGVGEDEPGAAARISLSATPNPFTSATSVAFALPREDDVSLSVYDIRGRVMKTLASGRHEAGIYAIEWDGRDLHGRRAAPGVYFLRLAAGPDVSLKKIIMLK